jgi:hypothetical protein
MRGERSDTAYGHVTYRTGKTFRDDAPRTCRRIGS